jgi:DNA-binding NarL/FixJ family response regulator
MPSAASSVRVFIADDSLAIRQRVGAFLVAENMKIVGEGATPQGCIDGILATHPDVVVLDVQLEGGNGLDVLKAIRAADPAPAFIVFSNNSGPAYRKRYLGAGAVRFLDKTAEFAQLAQAVALAARRNTH